MKNQELQIYQKQQRILQIPPVFHEEQIRIFIDQIEFIFSNGKNKLIRDFVFDISNINDINILGILVIYKFISYTVKNKVFFSPTLNWDPEGHVKSIFDDYGFTSLIEHYVNYSERDRRTIFKSYNELKESNENGLFCAPHSMLRDNEENRTILEENFLNKISEFYTKEQSDIVNLITSELMLNFWAHATEDTDSIIVAKGGKKYFKLYLIDNGEGLISSLKHNPDYQNMQNEILLLSAFKQGITSKPASNHQGRGLYLVKELLKLNKGELHLYTEGYQYRIKEKTENVIQAPFWKGVILELTIKLDKPRDVTHIVKENFRYKIRRIDNDL